MSDEEEKRPKDVYRERCSVTAYDLEVFVSEDGRQRGLWVGAGDSGKDRMKAFKPALEGVLEAWFRAKNGTNPISEMSYFHDILILFQDSMKEMGLLEWPEAEKLHAALGEAIARRPIEEEDVEDIRVIPTDDVIELGKRTYLPIKIVARCPNCDDLIISNLSGVTGGDGYLSYPTINHAIEVGFYHDKCGAEWKKKMNLKVSLEPVEEVEEDV